MERRSSQELIQDMMYYRKIYKHQECLPVNISRTTSDEIYCDSDTSTDGSFKSNYAIISRSNTSRSTDDTSGSVDVSTDTDDLINSVLIRTYKYDPEDIHSSIRTYLCYMRDAHAVYRKGTKERKRALDEAILMYDTIHSSSINSKLWYDNFFNSLESFMEELNESS
jgi:hypothetical protein